MSHSRRFIAVLIALAVFAAVPVIHAQDKALFALKAKVGDVTRTSIHISLMANIQGQQVPMELRMTDRSTVTEVSGEGRITLRQEVDSMSMSIAGNEIAGPPTPADVIVIGPDRMIVSYKSGDGDPQAAALQSRLYTASTVMLPGKPVAVGDAWSKAIAADAALGLQPAKVEFKVLAFEKVGTVDTVKVSIAYAETAADGLQTTGTCWLDRATGEDVKVEYQFKNAVFPEIGSTSGTVRQERVSR